MIAGGARWGDTLHGPAILMGGVCCRLNGFGYGGSVVLLLLGFEDGDRIKWVIVGFWVCRKERDRCSVLGANAGW